MRAILAAALAPVMLSSCAYVNPIVNYVPLNDDADTSVMPRLRKAVEDVEEGRKEVQSKRNQTIWTGRVLDLLTFGFAGGAAYAGISGNHVQSVTNATFAAGATYAGGRLFAPPDIVDVYNSGVVALACVASRGAALRASVARHGASIDRDDKAKRLDTLIASCTHDSNDVKNATVAQGRAKGALAYALASDAEEAVRVRQAANGVLAAVNREVLRRSNDPDAIFAAAKGLVPRASGTIVEVEDAQSLTRSAGIRKCAESEVGTLKQFTADYAEIEKAITKSVNAMATLDTSCVLDPVSTEPLTLSQDDVTIAKDATVKVIISGGRPPYAITELTSSPDFKVELIAPRTIVVTGLSTIKDQSKKFLTQVRDNSVIATPKTLKVSTAKP